MQRPAEKASDDATSDIWKLRQATIFFSLPQSFSVLGLVDPRMRN